MRITKEKIEISPSETIFWDEVKTMRLSNNKLAFLLQDNRVVELNDVRNSTIDLVFRTYETYLQKHHKKH